MIFCNFTPNIILLQSDMAGENDEIFDSKDSASVQSHDIPGADNRVFLSAPGMS